jgi:HK97 family phage major capsid protein
MDTLDEALDALKVGARNSGTDIARLQQIHDLAVENGASCEGEPPAPDGPQPSLPSKSVVTIKSMTDETATIAGYGVVFGDQDLDGETFSGETDLDLGLVPAKRVFYDHTLGTVKHSLGNVVKVVVDEIGVWIEAELQRSKQYVNEVLKLIEKGVLGWSSGSVPHLVRREGGVIKTWPVVEFSLTPTPCEPRTLGVERIKAMAEVDPTFKAFLPEADGELAADANKGETEAVTTQTKTEVQHIMDENEIKALVATAADAAATKAVEAFKASLPPVTGGLSVTKAAEDQSFKCFGDQLQAVKTFYVSGNTVMDPRLASIKAPLGNNEGAGSEGGFLLQPDFSTSLLLPLHAQGVFTSRIRPLPVGTNSNSGTINGVDETSRATGSRWGGIRGYRLAEADTKTASKPTFKQLTWKLKKYAVLCYATDELLQDAAQLEAVIRQGAGEELDFMANDDIINGLGAAGPLGVLASPALITVAKDANQAADTISYTNVTGMWGRLAPRSRASAVWYINADAQGQLDSLIQQAGLGAIPARFVQYGNDGLISIYGRPVVVTEFNATLGDLGDIVLFDPSEYLFWEKGGVQSASSIHVQFLTDETVFRFVYRCDGMPSWSSALTPYKGSTTTSPYVTLAARA